MKTDSHFKIIMSLGILMMGSLVSCMKIESIDMSRPEEITFRSIETKTTPTTTNTSIILGVNAKISGEFNEYFNNVKFEYDGSSSWIAKDPPQYWPNSGTLDFTLYAPYKSTDVTISRGSIEKSNVDAAEDFLYGAQIYANASKGDKAFPVVMKHAKAQIIVKFWANAASLYTVTDVKVKTVSTAGHVKVTYADVNLNNESVDWTTSTTADVLISKSNGLSVPSGTASSSAQAFGTPLMIIPGDLNVNSGNVVTQTGLEIHYTMKGKVCPPITLDLSGKWEVGKKYIYTLKFQANEIKFDASEEAWTPTPNESGTDLNI